MMMKGDAAFASPDKVYEFGCFFVHQVKCKVDKCIHRNYTFYINIYSVGEATIRIWIAAAK